MRRYGILLLLLAGLSAWAPRHGYGQETKPHMTLNPEVIVGVALHPDGRTPIANLPVRVWDREKKRFTFRSRTDKDGVFRVPQLKHGLRSLFVGRVRIDLSVLQKEAGGQLQRHDIVVVIPRKMVITVRPELFDIVLAPLLIRPPDPPRVVSP